MDQAEPKGGAAQEIMKLMLRPEAVRVNRLRQPVKFGVGRLQEGIIRSEARHWDVRDHCL